MSVLPQEQPTTRAAKAQAILRQRAERKKSKEPASVPASCSDKPLFAADADFNAVKCPICHYPLAVQMTRFGPGFPCFCSPEG